MIARGAGIRGAGIRGAGTKGAGKGVVACGHRRTAQAAAMVLDAGGNAFDAALAGWLAACVAEPVLASLGGGGFALARPTGEKPVVYDFFVQTPRVRRDPETCDFAAVTADFGTATQDFHCGWGSIAVPGGVAGLFALHGDLGHMPLAEIAAPALDLAREGAPLNGFQAHVLRVVEPILRRSVASEALFTGEDGRLLAEGERFALPAFRDALDALVHEGPALFYRGEMSQILAAECAGRGGHLTLDDLRAYAVARRAPLVTDYGDATVYSNPPPSSGGMLIAFALELLKGQDIARRAWGGEDHRRLLADVMGATNAARVEAAALAVVQEQETVDDLLLAPDLIARYRAQVAEAPKAFRGTTHISVLDGAGNACALSVSNGESSGCVLPETGILLNNMLGEEDLNPNGWHAWPRGVRMTSMMAPTLVLHNDGTETALGSGGSNRIRTAILQVLVNLVDFGLDPEDAVTRPRIHAENGLLSAELDLPEVLHKEWPRVQIWPDQSLFFGGVHMARLTAKGGLEGAADPRRDGVVMVT